MGGIGGISQNNSHLLEPLALRLFPSSRYADSSSQVPSKTHPLGALPDAGNLFDRLMAREEGGRQS